VIANEPLQRAQVGLALVQRRHRVRKVGLALPLQCLRQECCGIIDVVWGSVHGVHRGIAMAEWSHSSDNSQAGSAERNPANRTPPSTSPAVRPSSLH
jgi:hypothetical protein